MRSEMNDFKENVTSDAFWLRTLYIALFFLVYRVLDLVLLVVTLAQWVFRLLSGQPNEALASFGKSLGIYIQQIVHYLSGSSEEKPFPFKDWPADDE
ncbi:MAG: lipase [Oceanospirillaceae bacterium]|nr:lipase [Thalassolituus sp.]MAX97824.1 lipase [Oceanospirillaceae bacterium]MBL34824.1 lipase [Oceanospirillaceae bacterium]MBS53444.1 lipase [Oceanospirillaceae bacterium]